VRKLLASTERDRPDDIRDRALFLLLAVYGLRAGELLKLLLDDFDWEREVVTVTSSKTGRTRTYPWPGSSAQRFCAT
jgi:integrase/recombinase XerD